VLGGTALVDKLFVDLDGGGLVSVAISLEGGPPEAASKNRLEWPLDDEALEDLRWYLEDYLRAPYGVWEERGPRIQDRLAAWGEEIFGSVFGPASARDAYQRAQSQNLELVIRSAVPKLLGLPWELMHDSTGPVVLGLGGVSRALPLEGLGETVAVPGGRLRVLMVISRPAGTKDVGYRMIARPLLERLDAIRGQIDLVVLRPPTLDALRDALVEAESAEEPFQLVHFDGHGLLPGRRAGAVYPSGLPVAEFDRSAEGVLVFEKPGGGSDEVAASKVAAVLRDAKVPVVVLNACQSGAVGKDVEAAIATRLVREGCAAVVAMAYSVYAVAAAEFMAVFYERLFAGDTVSAAVSAGRNLLFKKDLRPSPKGDLPLADWLVPVHYMRHDVRFPEARTKRATAMSSLEALLDESRKPPPEQASLSRSLDPTGGFIGRDALFYKLEEAAREHKVVLLHGPGGIGKTELAKAFGRWWHDTGAVQRPEWILWHSFEPGAASFGLDGVITKAGLQLFGSDFALLNSIERRQKLQNLLAEQRILLIWDNFETVRSMPDPVGTTPRLDETDCQEVKKFLTWLAGSSESAVIITSRTAEDWLGTVCRLEVGGLTRDEAILYADELLTPHPAAAPHRARRAFGELLDWLDGHPLSMRLILPLLNDSDPETLLNALRGISPLPVAIDDADGGRTTSLAASITYSFAHLSQKTRQLLPAVSLFHSITDANLLAFFSSKRDVPERFAGASDQDWKEVLGDAARVGLLAPRGGGMYQIHPALPSYLAAQWRVEEPTFYDATRDAATRALVDTCSTLGTLVDEQIDSGEPEIAYTLISLHQRTFCAMLDYSLKNQFWEQALQIIQPLNDYWEADGQEEEAAVWGDRVRAATEGLDGTPPPLDTPAGSLWLFIAGEQAKRRESAFQLDEAEDAYREMLALILSQSPSPRRQESLSTAYHQLGVIALHRGQLNNAEGWCRKALTIHQEIDDRLGIAKSYHQLGTIAQLSNQLDAASEWYHKALLTFEDVGNRPGMGMSYHQLGTVAQEQQQLDDAERWYIKSLAVASDIGDLRAMAQSYGNLGTVSTQRLRPQAAENWHRKALAIFEELGNLSDLSVTYGHLATLAVLQGRLSDAEGWCLKALAVSEQAGNRTEMAVNYGMLGVLAEYKGQPRQALEWMIRCIALFADIGDPATRAAPAELTRLTAELGLGALETSWQDVTGDPLPETVRNYVILNRSKPRM
jgi:tetratricopeptide (TPR) repeat protein